MIDYDCEKVPESFVGMFRKLAACGIRTDRHTALNYDIIIPKNKTLARFPTYTLPESWNKLPFTTQVMSSKTSFKDAIMESMFSNYQDTVKCNDRSCPDCH